MTLLNRRLTATNEKLAALREARKADAKTRRQTIKESRADRERKLRLVGAAVLHRLACGDWDEADFRRMMDGALTRAADRTLFGLDDALPYDKPPSKG
ncbi:hypothetical protein [Methylocapsa sp. S129]|uniref:hypothetical protein n=1 Tax=Methylocapsa sp. S129 TaxID=1641869 RepID=UPI00131D78DD|nr:hypothetical protein [Methylocapsa sp. S129]